MLCPFTVARVYVSSILAGPMFRVSVRLTVFSISRSSNLEPHVREDTMRRSCREVVSTLWVYPACSWAGEGSPALPTPPRLYGCWGVTADDHSCGLCLRAFPPPGGWPPGVGGGWEVGCGMAV
jgi:hypothetical protein